MAPLARRRLLVDSRRRRHGRDAYRRGDSEIVVALDAATGTTRWEHTYLASLTHNGYFDVWLNAAGPGPYSTPLIADDTVFAVGVTGKFHALDLRTGAVRWSHDLVALFAPSLQELCSHTRFGYSERAWSQDEDD